MNIIIKYWTGWITSRAMNTPGWIETWSERADMAKAENCELVVFKIPLNKSGSMADPETVDEIELLLQEKFG